MIMRKLPYARQQIDQADIEAVTKVLQSDFLTTGPEVRAFEQDLCDFLGCREAVVCANGSSALYLLAQAYGILYADHWRGKTVLAPSISFNATAAAFKLAGANIIFYDADKNDASLTPERLSLLFERTDIVIDAVVSVHLNGKACDLHGLKSLCDQHNIPLFDDACHALGTSYHDGMIGDGALTKASCFSFHAIKNITCGEGGAITTNDIDLAKLMRQLRHHGMVNEEGSLLPAIESHDKNSDEMNLWYHQFQYLSLNHRLSDIACALGRSQLKKLPDWIIKRRQLVAYYNHLLQEQDHIHCVSYDDGKTAWHVMVVAIDFQALPISRHLLMQKLRDDGILTQLHYIPLPYQPIWHAEAAILAPYPDAEFYYQHALSLPLYVDMQHEDVDFVVARLLHYLS
jgi:dTDP-4-amino-4,6-dideoxygalactose transaminase